MCVDEGVADPQPGPSDARLRGESQSSALSLATKPTLGSSGSTVEASSASPPQSEPKHQMTAQIRGLNVHARPQLPRLDVLNVCVCVRVHASLCMHRRMRINTENDKEKEKKPERGGG